MVKRDPETIKKLHKEQPRDNQKAFQKGEHIKVTKA